jgi:hypothetical protein
LTISLFLLFQKKETLLLEEAQRPLGHNVEYVVEEKSPWQDNEKVTPTHGKVDIGGRCYENQGWDIAQS